jgi:hypothetical protein
MTIPWLGYMIGPRRSSREFRPFPRSENVSSGMSSACMPAALTQHTRLLIVWNKRFGCGVIRRIVIII